MTHGIHYLPHVDRIIVLDGGRITEVGTYSELESRGEKFAKFIKEYATKQNEEEEIVDGEKIEINDLVVLNFDLL